MEIENSTSTDHPPVYTFLLLICGGFFHFIQTATADTLYIWAFRALTIISLSLVIYINWNKALEIFKSKRKQ